MQWPAKAKAILALAVLGGTLLSFIGIRYLLVPEAAARSFGLRLVLGDGHGTPRADRRRSTAFNPIA